MSKTTNIMMYPGYLEIDMEGLNVEYILNDENYKGKYVFD
jgi:hypothetical protein